MRTSIFNSNHYLMANFDPLIIYLPICLTLTKNWDVSPELQYEPEIALFAEDEGLKLILQLISQAPRCLTSEGLLFIEADPQQHNRIIDEAVKNGFVKERVLNYILVLSFTGAQD